MATLGLCGEFGDGIRDGDDGGNDIKNSMWEDSDDCSDGKSNSTAPQRNGGCEGTVKKKKHFPLLIFNSFFILPNSQNIRKNRKWCLSTETKRHVQNLLLLNETQKLCLNWLLKTDVIEVH